MGYCVERFLELPSYSSCIIFVCKQIAMRKTGGFVYASYIESETDCTINSRQ